MTTPPTATGQSHWRASHSLYMNTEDGAPHEIPDGSMLARLATPGWSCRTCAFFRDKGDMARNSSDWHRLLEICAITDTLILDEDGIYDPRRVSHSSDRS
jgi:hypothetical protein